MYANVACYCVHANVASNDMFCCAPRMSYSKCCVLLSYLLGLLFFVFADWFCCCCMLDFVVLFLFLLVSLSLTYLQTLAVCGFMI